MNRYIITFGSNHTDRRGEPLSDRYLVLGWFDSEDAAREVAFAVRGRRWSHLYHSESETGELGNVAGIEDYRLTEVRMRDATLVPADAGDDAGDASESSPFSTHQLLSGGRLFSYLPETLTKRWGGEEILYVGEYMLKRLTLTPGERTSMHFHYGKTETLFVLSGDLLVSFQSGASDVHLRRGETLTIRAGRVNAHRMISGRENGCVYVEASTPHVDDSERVEL